VDKNKSDNLHLMAITSDNLPLSANRSSAPKTLAAADLDAAVAEYLLAARAPNTHRAYACDLSDFEIWGGHIPSTPDEIARYVAQRASVLRPSTLRRRLAALASIHRDRGLADPTKATLVRRVVQGIERKHGTAVAQAAPLLIDHLASIVAVMGTSGRDLRDRAILLVGFFGALRRSEIVALKVSSLAQTSGGLALLVTRSKTDQTGHGRTVHLHARSDALCPVQALADWLSASGIRDGAVFRQVDAGVLEHRLSDRAVATIVKHWAAAAGLPAERFSGHSLRAGFATSAAMAGFDATLIARQTGHRTQQALSAYVRPDPTFVSRTLEFERGSMRTSCTTQ
jgi:integrase